MTQVLASHPVVRLVAALAALLPPMFGVGCVQTGGSKPLPEPIVGQWCRAEKSSLTLLRIGGASDFNELASVTEVFEHTSRTHGKPRSLVDGGAVRWFEFTGGGRDDERWLVYQRVAETTGFDQSATIELQVASLDGDRLVFAGPLGAFERIAAEPAADAKSCKGQPGTTAGTIPAAKLALDSVLSLDTDTSAAPGDVHRLDATTFAVAWTGTDSKLRIARHAQPGSAKWTRELTASDTHQAPVHVRMLSDGRVFAAWPYRAALHVDGYALDAWNGSGTKLSRAIAVAGFDGDGKASWLQHIGGPGGDDDANGLAIGNDGAVTVAATIRSSPTYVAPKQGDAEDYPAKVLLAQLSATGSPKTTLQLTNAQPGVNQRALAMATDASGNLRLLGAANAQAPAEKVVCWGTCVRFLRSTLHTRWTVNLTASVAAAGGIAVDADGETFVAVSGGGGTVVARLAEPDGAVKWRVDAATAETVSGVAALTDGTVLVAGYTVATTPKGWLRGYDKAGKPAWIADLGAVEGAEVSRIVAGAGSEWMLLGRSVSGTYGGVAVGKGVFLATLHVEVTP